MSLLNKTVMSFVVSVALYSGSAVYADDLSDCAANTAPAVYDAATRMVRFDALDIPLLNPWTGLPNGYFGVFKANLQLQVGIEDFKLLDVSYVDLATQFNPTHGRYDYFFDDSPFSNGGKLTFCVSVPQVLTLPTGQQIEAPPQKHLAVLKQLAVDPSVYHIFSLTKADGNGNGNGNCTATGTCDCNDLATKDAVQAQLLEMFTLIETVKPMIVVDYWSSGGTWAHPLS